MALTRTITYSGTVETMPMFRQFTIVKEFTPDGVATGGVGVTATFFVVGEEISVSATVPQAQLAGMTLQALLTAAAAKLATKLGV